MATEASHAPLVRDITGTPTMWRHFIAAITPWYDWGREAGITNMDARTNDEIVDGDVRFFDLQWFGLHIGFRIGRTPKAVR